MSGKKTTCPTCGGTTSEYIFRFDALDAQLLFQMARDVKTRMMQKQLPFHDANQVHVPTLMNASLAVRCRTTQASKLGLIAKLREGGKHVPGKWVITDRGWAALRGELVPAEVRVFRKEIVERPGAVIAMQDAFKLDGYTSTEWYFFGKSRVEIPRNGLF